MDNPKFMIFPALICLTGFFNIHVINFLENLLVLNEFSIGKRDFIDIYGIGDT